MAKMYIIIICLLLVSAFNDSAGQDLLNARTNVEYTYLSQIGVKQTGHNTGPQVEAYLAATNLGPGYPWCAAFVAWVLTENNINNPQSAWSPSYFARRYIIWSKQKPNNTPLPGDVFGIYYTSLGRIAHVGFVHRFSESITVTVEGNTNDTGSRTGDGVYIKRRPTRQLHLISRYIHD